MTIDIEEQHPIPQQISSYQFKLVGDMTLKQFLQVAGGSITALLLYASPLHPALKWPLMIFSFVFGIALAFMPLADRPLGKWIVVFFRSVYSPTIFVWKKTDKPVTYFQPEGVVDETRIPPEEAASLTVAPPADETAKEEQEALTKLEHKEISFLGRISQLFNVSSLMGSASQQTPDTPSSHKVKIPEPQVITYPQSEQKDKVVEPEINVDVYREELEKEVEETTSTVVPTKEIKSDITGKQAIFSQDAAPPIPPTKENIVVGQVLGPGGNILEGAILEIKDGLGRPVRALKTNKLGHFMIVTPLLAGEYKMITEKEGYEFEPVHFMAENKIIPPIAIRASKMNQDQTLTELN